MGAEDGELRGEQRGGGVMVTYCGLSTEGMNLLFAAIDAHFGFAPPEPGPDPCGGYVITSSGYGWSKGK